MPRKDPPIQFNGDDGKARGIRCPRCQHDFSWNCWTRHRIDPERNQSIKVRARECRRCGYRFQTEERLSLP
jgi:DNA-directed RNA polymerase subunit RPC12/RpoP